MPAQRITASSSLTSMAKVTAPSMSAGVSPASATAAATASPASWSSLRPECLENSVWPMPTMAVSRDSAIRHLRRSARRRRDGTGGAPRRRPPRCSPRPRARCPRHPASTPSRFDTKRMPSSSSTSTTTRGSASGLVGWCDTIHVYTWPCPDDSCVSHSTEWHSPHIGAGGCRTTPHAEQRWKTRRPSAIASQKNWSSRVGDGGITDGTSRPPIEDRLRLGRGHRCGRRRTRAPAGWRACPAPGRATVPARRLGSR